MSRNGQRHPARPRIELSGGGSVAAREGAGLAGAGAMASPEEAAAIAAAIEQFMRDTTPTPAAGAAAVGPWLRTALLEGTGRGCAGPSSWGDPVRWGSQPPG
jgi:hypothetical protein